MKIRKDYLLLTGGALLATLLVDQPMRAVPTFWQSGLAPRGDGRFVIQREGDITLKYVTASTRSQDLEVVPVPFYRGKGPATESVREIARHFGNHSRRTVLAAINGGFFDTSTGLPIGFLLRDGQMEFFNMPQGFTRSMVGFTDSKSKTPGARVHIASPRKMPKVWMDTQAARLAIHHINVPGGKHALALYTPLYARQLRLPANAIYAAACPEPQRPGVYRITTIAREGSVVIPEEGVVVAMHGYARSNLSALKKGSLIRPGWSLPDDWRSKEVTHGLLAGPRLLEKGRVQVTAKEERLDKLKSRDRMVLAVKKNGEILLLWAHRNTAGNLSFEELASTLKKMGAEDAIALDGGKSRAIFAQQGDAPADERYFEGGRPVSNVLVLALRQRTAI